ncbi:YfiR family protein [Massilia glaciei]|uniref:YfiR family protein n=1 Tax=Massilia glaciei TaxID=1524097 RepID=A0A2U2HM99_9BURK|nr:YfiR family protein [Massilia glaciei]
MLVRALRNGEPLAGCRAALVLPGAPEELAALRAGAGREHVLLFGEGGQMAAQGVHIGFFPDQGRLRVEVNRKALEASGLKASFRLLEVAKIVE